MEGGCSNYLFINQMDHILLSINEVVNKMGTWDDKRNAIMQIVKFSILPRGLDGPDPRCVDGFGWV